MRKATSSYLFVLVLLGSLSSAVASAQDKPSSQPLQASLPKIRSLQNQQKQFAAARAVANPLPATTAPDRSTAPATPAVKASEKRDIVPGRRWVPVQD